MTKFSLDVLTGKALSFLLEFIDETGEKVFCLQMQIKLIKSFVTSFINKLKTKLKIFFFQDDFKYKKNSQLFFSRSCYNICLTLKTLKNHLLHRSKLLL